MKSQYIKIRGAKENNLKNIDVDIPRDKLVVLTGLSGSGKSSLAFDTIYAEGQRRYMESLSSYARMFLGQVEKPNVESIEGLSPAISIDQKSTNKNPRSTVGTVTEIYDYMRLLYARIGVVHCPKCNREIFKQSIDQMVDRVLLLEEGSKIQILSPVVKGKKGRHEKLIESIRKSGFSRVIIDDIQYDLSEDINLDKNIKHNIDVIVDRLIIKDGIRKRLSDSIEISLKLSEGYANVDVISKEVIKFSENFTCAYDGTSIEEPEPRSFSFNNPFGACPNCFGLGYITSFDEDLVIPDKTLSLNEGAIIAIGWQSLPDKKSFANALMVALSKKFKFDLDTPFKDYKKEIQNLILYGTDEEVVVEYESTRGSGEYKIKFEGLLKNLEKRYNETTSDAMRAEYEQFMRKKTCLVCEGKRLKKDFLAVTVGGKNIFDATNMSILKFKKFLEELKLSDVHLKIGELILKEIRARVNFLIDVGLDYLSLSRATSTLSGGEAQRIRLATQIGSGLQGVLYILDEPSIGLHQRDNDKLLDTLKNLRDLGNSVIVVEHDEDTMLASDYIIDIGPSAGMYGGELVFAGTPKQILKSNKSITGKYLSKKINIEMPKKRREIKEFIKIRGARHNNLKNIDVDIPLSVMTCITGVSGSGKSSLINEILYKALAKKLNKSNIIAGEHDEISGIDKLDKIIAIDQSPIGRTPRSNPATYTGLFDLIRDLYANVKEAKQRGYSKGRFSFNVKGGRCESCSGDGIKKIEMHFLPDIYVPCEVCKGKRYNKETLEVKYKDKSIYDILEMTVLEALEFFENIPSIHKKLSTINEVGLSYIKLGQASTLLSGGEAQRIKLATELSKRGTGKTIYILDEPTTGLHFADVHKLVGILRSLSDTGNTVVVIEHNLEVIKMADYIIDIGKEGGDKGGEIIAFGTPEEVSKNENSYTGKYLKKYFK